MSQITFPTSIPISISALSLLTHATALLSLQILLQTSYNNFANFGNFCISFANLGTGQSNTTFTFTSFIFILYGLNTTSKKSTFLTFHLYFSGFMCKLFSSNLLNISATNLSYLFSIVVCLDTNIFLDLIFLFLLLLLFDDEETCDCSHTAASFPLTTILYGSTYWKVSE